MKATKPTVMGLALILVLLSAFPLHAVQIKVIANSSRIRDITNWANNQNVYPEFTFSTTIDSNITTNDIDANDVIVQAGGWTVASGVNAYLRSQIANGSIGYYGICLGGHATAASRLDIAMNMVPIYANMVDKPLYGAHASMKMEEWGARILGYGSHVMIRQIGGTFYNPGYRGPGGGEIKILARPDGRNYIGENRRWASGKDSSYRPTDGRGTNFIWDLPDTLLGCADTYYDGRFIAHNMHPETGSRSGDNAERKKGHHPLWVLNAILWVAGYDNVPSSYRIGYDAGAERTETGVLGVYKSTSAHDFILQEDYISCDGAIGSINVYADKNGGSDIKVGVWNSSRTTCLAESDWTPLKTGTSWNNVPLRSTLAVSKGDVIYLGFCFKDTASRYHYMSYVDMSYDPWIYFEDRVRYGTGTYTSFTEGSGNVDFKDSVSTTVKGDLVGMYADVAFTAATPSSDKPSEPSGLVIAGSVPAAEARWFANSETDLDSYRLHWGTTSRGSAAAPSQFSYEHQTAVAVSPAPTATVANLQADATYYFAVTALDADGNESAYSAEAIFGPGLAFTAYNDLAWFSGQLNTQLTCYTTTNGGSGASPVGQLVDSETGAALPVALTVTGGGIPNAGQGADAAAGTDADLVFGGNVDCAGTVTYATDDLVLELTGLDPDYRYELVLYSDRNAPSYTGGSARHHVATISGADGYRNESTPGVTILSGTCANDTVTYVSGYNNPSGYVTRFTEIDPGPDRAITITLERDAGLSRYTYANALMLKATSRRESLASATGTWHYRKGTAEASVPACAWRAVSYDDAGWQTGVMPIGYSSDPAGEGPFNTTLDDMKGAYSSVFLRRTFTVENPGAVSELTLSAELDDGMIVWINGEELARANCSGTAGTFKAHTEFAASSGEPVPWTLTLQGRTLPHLLQGENVLAVQVFNATLGSSDLKFDMALSALPGELAIADDGDRNDITDSWELSYFASAGQDPTADPDADGVSTLGEWVCGTDPTSGASSFQVDLAAGPSGLIISFFAKQASGPDYTGYTRHYTLQQRSDLLGAAWVPVPGYENVPGTDTTVAFTNSTPTAATCYRGRVWLED